MRQFYHLAHDSNRQNLESIVDYELGEFDDDEFTSGKEFLGRIPPEVKLWLSDGTPSDWLANPLSWPIVSEKLLQIICNKQDFAIQHLTLPVFRLSSEVLIERFLLLNPLERIDTVDKPGDLLIDFVFDEKSIPRDLHIFRPRKAEMCVCISGELYEFLRGKGLKGLALIPAKTV